MAFSNPGAARGTLSGNIFAGTTTLGPSTAIQGLGDLLDDFNKEVDEWTGTDNSAGGEYTGEGSVGPGDPLIQDPSLTCSQQGGTWNAATKVCKPKATSGGGGGGAVAPKPPTTPAPAAATGFSLDSITADPLMLGGAVVVALVGFVLYKKHAKKTRGY